MYDMRELRENMENGKVDLCITATHDREAGWDDYEIVSLAKAPAKIVVSAYHPWVMKNEITVEDLENCAVVKMDIPQATTQDYFVQMPCKEKIIVRNSESMYLELEQGKCFTVIPAEWNNYSEKNGKSFPLPCNPFDFELALIYKKNNTNALLPAVCELLKEEFEP